MILTKESSMKKLKKYIIGIRILLAICLTAMIGTLGFPKSVYATNPGIDIASYPWEALFADENGEVECHYITGPTVSLEKYLVPREDGGVELLTGENISENYTLSYWLHVPANYDPAKTYPILSIFPGVGALYFSQNILFGSAIDQGALQSEQYTYALRRYGYTQGTLYLTSDWNALSAINAKTRDENGNVREGFPGTGAVYHAFGGNYDGHFLENWGWNIQDDPSYDCFVLFIQPEGALMFDDDGSYPVVLYKDENGMPHASNYKYETEGAADLPVAYAQALSTANSAQIGAGWWVDDTQYGSTYFASVLGKSPLEQVFIQLLDEMESKYSIDVNREYLMGDSVGGLFVFDLLSQYPDRFAAAVTAAATGADISYSNVNQLGNIHLLAFHDSYDPGYSINFSRLFVEKVNQARGTEETGSAQFIEVETNHSGVTQLAYNGENYEYVLHFLFGHQRESGKETVLPEQSREGDPVSGHFMETPPIRP